CTRNRCNNHSPFASAPASGAIGSSRWIRAASGGTQKLRRLISLCLSRASCQMLAGNAFFGKAFLVRYFLAKQFLVRQKAHETNQHSRARQLACVRRRGRLSFSHLRWRTLLG